VTDDPIVPQALVRKEDLVNLLKSNFEMYHIIKDLNEVGPEALTGDRIKKALKFVEEHFI
jgi:hypothetical protein